MDKVDVLAVISAMRLTVPEAQYGHLCAAQSAVADLIEAAQCVCRTPSDADWAALDAALARVGGA